MAALTTLEIQKLLTAHGFDPGPHDGIPGPKTYGALRAFQSAKGLAVDGICGPNTTAALKADPVTDKPVEKPNTAAIWRPRVIPIEWMPDCKMERIIVHWSGGSNRVSDLDLAHYHIVLDGAGKPYRGRNSIEANVSTADGRYAAHTLNCNQGSIGVSLAGMVGAVERPFKPGISPITRAQWDALPNVLADLCQRYKISVEEKTVLSHAEVGATLGRPQRGKWDIAILPFDLSFNTAAKVGEEFRRRTAALMA